MLEAAFQWEDQPATFAAVKGLRDPQAPTRAAAAAALGEAALAGNSALRQQQVLSLRFFLVLAWRLTWNRRTTGL